MEIPKYIDTLLEKRAKAAETFINTDTQIYEWLNKNDISVSNDDIQTGACSLCEPYNSIERIRDCIKQAENK